MVRFAPSLLCVLLVVALLLPAQAQAPLPSVDTVARGIAMSQAQGIRLMGMGGVTVSVRDIGNIRNPAAMVKASAAAPAWRPFWVVDQGGTTFSPTGSTPNGVHFNVRATTVGLGDGGRQLLAARLARVSAPRYRSIIMMGGVPTPIDQDIGYDSFLLGYGRKIGRGLYGSLMLAGGDATGGLYLPGTPVSIGRIYADPDPGFECAFYYDITDSVSVGGVWTTIRGVETRVIQGVPPTSRLIRSNIYRVGVSYQPDRWTTLAAEWGGLSFKDKTNNASTSDSRFYFGAERWVTPDVAVRAGSFGGQMSVGVGAKIRGLTVDYAYVKDLNKKSSQRLFPTVPSASSRTNYFAVSGSF